MPFDIEVDFNPNIHLASRTMASPVIHSILIGNRTDNSIEDAVISLTFDPAVANSARVDIPMLVGGESIRIDGSTLDLHLSHDKLVNQTETTDGRLTIELWIGETSIAQQSFDFKVLAYNQWSGLAVAPEYLAAFVTPNHPSVADWISTARELAASNGVDSFDGYQSNDRNKIRGMVSSVFDTVKRRGIQYANPPASFDKYGQKIRTIDQIDSDHAGTCLDLSVGLCSVLEQMGLNPFLILMSGHAFLGVWLTDYTLPMSWVDDASAVRKRVDLHEAVVFDSSSATSTSFAEAITTARTLLLDEENFHFVLDIKRCRMNGVNPISVLRTNKGYEKVAPTAVEGGLSGKLESIVEYNLRTDEKPTDKLERWKSKLLDLTLRNKLLNDTEKRKQVLPLLGDPGQIEDELISSNALTCTMRPRGGADALEDVAIAESLARRELLVDLPEGDFNKRMVELYRLNKSHLTETGSSPIYLALGLLRWFESPSSQQERFAPLVLVPVFIERESVKGPYRIVLGEDEPMINITLVKKLENDFGVKVRGAYSDLPEDANGLDIDAIFAMFRHAVKDVARFDVMQSARIALYNFKKFLMWSDLDVHTEALLKNPIVNHLLDGTSKGFKNTGIFVEPSEIETAVETAADLSVVDSDSSQLAAVFSSINGCSFVLQGPPGTGKSQTITNIIGQALGAGKTVLFVSEKRAALEVVESRLEKVGLGPFTLEVHSDKASKADVVSQLREPYDFNWPAPTDGWVRHARHLKTQKEVLNRYVKAIHAPGPYGESIFRTLSKLIESGDAPHVPLPPAFRVPDRDFFQSVEKSASSFQSETKNIVPNAPWKVTGVTEWSAEFQREVKATTVRLQADAGELQNALKDASRTIFGDEHQVAMFANHPKLFSLLLAPVQTTTALLTSPIDVIAADLDRVFALLDERAKNHAIVRSEFTDELDREFDISKERRAFQKWAASFLAFFILFFARRRLAQVAVKTLPSNDRVVEALESAERVRVLESEISKVDGVMRQYFGVRWRNEDSDVNGLRGVWDWTRSFRKELSTVPTQWGENTQRLEQIVTSPAEQRGPGTPMATALKVLNERLLTFETHRAEFWKMLKISSPQSSPDEVATLTHALLGTLPTFRDWCDWRKSAVNLQTLGLAPIVAGASSGTIAPDDILNTTLRSVRQQHYEATLAANPNLSEFRGRQHDEVVVRFRQLDEEAKSLALQEIQARLSARLPNFDAPGEMDILRREFKKTRGHKAPRKLFSEVPNVLLRLKPCVLMSPLSVARYLEPSLALFDLVVFDEASQIPPWDAVGALARGKQAVIVGDSKQLPPTTFFGQADNLELLEEDQIDLESILDEAVAAGIPELSLGWHYRSRHENLIAFSNHNYYDNRLNVFPCANSNVEGLGVKWVHVPEGYYDRGKSRTNLGEAKRIVAEIVRRLKDPILSEKTIGVVAFSVAQQRCVEDLLDEERRRNPDIEFAFKGQEPLFVKNLENVQGDERDVILFTIGYGPDRSGRLTMAFGPINRKGGERRLNVAVTRARELLTVYSTLQPGQIDLSRTNATGARQLKTFLDYAARGTVALDQMVKSENARDWDSPFEIEVQRAIEARGYEVHRQIGVGNFFIDLAVLDPKNPGRYLLGVECDGAMYHSAVSARDRDRVRQAVLENLGWTIHRVWSTDWWHDRRREGDRIEAVLKALENAPISMPKVEKKEYDILPPERSEAIELAAKNWPANATAWVPPKIDPELSDNYEPDEHFYDEEQEMSDAIRALVATHAPLDIKHLSQLIGQAWERKSTTKKVVNHITTLANATLGVYVNQQTVWKSPDQMKDFSRFRYSPSDQPAPRRPEQIPAVEVDEAVFWAVKYAVALDMKSLVREVGQVFGFARSGKRINEMIAESVARLESAKRVHQTDEKVTLVS